MIDMRKYREMDCPVCGKFYFSRLEDKEKASNDFIECTVCGWRNDLYQTKHPDSVRGANAMSLNDYKKDYEKKIEENPNYNYLESVNNEGPHKCPVCGRHTFPERSSFSICPYCGWEDDELMEDEPDKWAGCANDLCLNDFRERYKRILKSKPDYKFKKDGNFE